MDTNIKNTILSYTQETSIRNFFAFERIPQKKLKSAIRNYAPISSAEETVIFLYDDTLFGSAKSGFLLTTKRLYQKNMLGKASATDIENITSLFIKKGFPASLSVSTNTGLIDIELTQIASKIISKAENSLLNLLNKTIETLGGKHVIQP